MKRVMTPNRVYISLLIVVGALLRLWDISKSSIWHDEGYTMMLAPMSPLQIIARTGRDVHPPLYYEVLHFWMLLFGNSELSARGLSAACMLGIIPLTYLLMRNLWTERAAKISALLVTAGPFLVRYSQEARMYGMVAFLLLLATYALVRAMATNRWTWWSLYAVAIAASLYTHYYSVFMIVVHWIFIAAATHRQARTGLWNWRWGVANVVAAGLFLPWVPVAYAQFKRVQNSFWIPRATISTLPNTMFNFLTYGGPHVSDLVKVALSLPLIAALVYLFIRFPGRRLSLLLISAYALLAPGLIWLVSYAGNRPIYVDRYFVFAAVGFYILIGIWIASFRFKLQATFTIISLVLFAIGLHNIHVGANHQMRVVGNYVTQHFQPGDEILSGELYTFFDFSYYNHTGAQTKLWSKNGVNGYGESSLIYDRSNEIVVRNLTDIHPASGHLWVVGKTGTKDYYDHVPATWQPMGPKITAGTSAVQEYLIAPRRSGAVAVQ